MIKYPEIKVKLTGINGNAYSIMGTVQTALQRGLKKQGMTSDEIKSEIDLYIKESTSGDYNNLLVTAMKWVNVS